MKDAHVIQNPDINVGPGSYKTLATDQLLVARGPGGHGGPAIFYTVQGEGPFAGHPAVFVRLAGCNRGRKTDMGCRFCDTSFQYSLGTAMNFSLIADYMASTLESRKVGGKENVVVVITGGEPMMQNNLAAFCHYLHQYRHWGQVQIESNGDRLAPGFDRKENWLTLVVSPKVSKAPGVPLSAGVVYEYKEPNGAVFDRADFFKFLIEAVPGSPYEFPPEYAQISARPTYLSPITQYERQVAPGEVVTAWNHRLVNVPQTRANYTRAVELAMKYSMRVSMQQHLFFGVP